MMSLRSKITGDDPENLSSMFDSAFTIVEDVTDTQLETNSTEYQVISLENYNLKLNHTFPLTESIDQRYQFT